MALGKDGKYSTHPVRKEDTREQQLVQIRQAACLVRLPKDSVAQQQSNSANGQLYLKPVGKYANNNYQKLTKCYPPLVQIILMLKTVV